MAALLGALLDGRYRIDSPIARGGTSTVYRGVDTRLDRPVAVKVMNPSFADDPEFLARFELEARSVARLSHSGLVAVHDQGTDDGHAFLVMELVEGGTVRELLRERGGALAAAEALAVVEPTLAALSTAHRAGLVHRDVKPENVLISDGGAVKVADFGLVRAVAAAGATSTGMILGTVAYLSPEQVTTGSADARSDVYSAGVLLFELLTGTPPFGGDTALSVAYQHVNSAVPAPSSRTPGLAPALDAVVARATRHDPAERFPDAGAMLGELISVRRALDLPRVRLAAPVRSAEHASQRGVQHTRAMTTATPAAPGPATLQPTDTDRVPTVTAFQAERHRARRTAMVWILVVALVTAAVGVGAWWLGSGQFTTVPELAGLSRTEAEAALTEADLDPVLETAYDDATTRETVLDAEPTAGAEVPRGSDVVLTLSLGRPVVPEIDPGTATTLVDQLLEEVTLAAEPTEGRYDDTVTEGSLLSLDPPAGTPLAVGSTVRVTLSRGPAPVTVPDVRGVEVERATDTLTASGLGVGGTTSEFAGDVPGGSVIRTEPAVGTETPSTTPVTLVVSSALTVPDVLGRSAEQARTTLADAGLTGVATPSDAGGVVTATDPAVGTLLDPANAQVQLTITEQVVVPGVRGRTVGTARQRLEALGLTVEVSQLVETDSSLVVSLNPPAGTALAPGSTVTITAFP